MRSQSLKQYNRHPKRPSIYSTSPPVHISNASTIWEYDQSMTIPKYTPSPLMTSSNLPPKGKVHSLKRESHGIPIPGRAQSHDDIHMFSSPPSSASGRYSPSKFIICNSPGSPPAHHYGQAMPSASRNVTNSSGCSYSASPLSSSVPTGGGVDMHRLA